MRSVTWETKIEKQMIKMSFQTGAYSSTAEVIQILNAKYI